ncbi:Coiled-coil domain-containing protein 9 [Chelonia mydas]|uniref:Coiled-coil domain-containing protein 9 n=1 Tax=Chelonia mydas TaxID=8469 RepID=M7AU55_CHEMY|nr:Coiled-coil domain-containing protein 9 [Chelonia mydas]
MRQAAAKEWEERRRQNIEKMNEEMEKIAEYERNQRDGLQEKNPVRNFLDDPRRSGSFQEADRKEGSRRHVRNWGGPDFDKVKTGMEREKEWHAPEGCGTAPEPDPGARRDENKRPPRPPTFGEFLSEHRAERRRKGRGRPAPTKPYRPHFPQSRHGDSPSRDQAPSPAPSQQAEGLAPQLPPEPQQPPDEDEDQWEDVSEEDDDEGHLSSSGEEEEVPPVGAPKAPRAPKVGRGPAPKLDMPPPGAHGGQGKALSPFSPAEGPQPVSDWGEEMELNSPRGSVRDSTPQGPGPAPQAQGAGPPGETAGAAETLSQLEPEPALGVVQITDVERVCFRKTSALPAGC